MSEHYSRHSNKKLYTGYQEKKRKSHKQIEPSKHASMDCKTPPLPVKPTRRTSIEDLIKRRETLKRELTKIKHSDSARIKPHKSPLSEKYNKHSKSEYSKIRHHIDSVDVLKNKKINTIQFSPEHNGDFAKIESEDEESIIEKRREQRKKLIETLSHKQSQGIINTANIEKINKTRKNMLATAEDKKATVSTDMFSEKDDFPETSGPDQVKQDNIKQNAELADNWDDTEGYYSVRVGDEIDNNRYTIKSILGQGVFANVVRASDNQDNKDVAIKIVRNNELMYRTGLKEIIFLKELKDADPGGKYHCVNYFRYFLHKSHLCLVLEPLYMDMRSVLKKYGRNHGINIKALVSFSRQLLSALRLLKKIGVVHADIKPDNVLINEKKNILKLCDFGSAIKIDENEATPYLVSRFYRAPEIILGIPYKHSIDIWSTACTFYEMATGKIMFAGGSNNKMLKCFMDLKGKFPARLIRKGKFKDQHFNYNNNYLLHKKDEFTGRDKVVEVCNVNITRDLSKDLRKTCKHLTDSEDKKLTQLKDILDKMLMLDLNQRYTVLDCLKHPYIHEDLDK